MIRVFQWRVFIFGMEINDTLKAAYRFIDYIMGRYISCIHLRVFSPVYCLHAKLPGCCPAFSRSRSQYTGASAEILEVNGLPIRSSSLNEYQAFRVEAYDVVCLHKGSRVDIF